MELLEKILLFALIPTGTMLIGEFTAMIFNPSKKFRSIILHFAAGIVFSVVAVELLPDILENAKVLDVGIGFSLGILVLMSIKHFFHASEKKHAAAEKKIPIAMLTAIGIDIFIDGILIGTGFATGESSGILLTIALAVEIFSLGIALSSELIKTKMDGKKRMLILLALPLLILIGAFAGALLLNYLSHDTLEIVLSFGLAALLFLVTEELLVEAHEESDTPLVSAMFFLGFLLFLILGMLA